MAEPKTAKALGLVLCHDCRMLVEWPDLAVGHGALCPRCGAELHQRKPNSLARTWAFLIAAAILYVPANVLPMMVTSSFGDVQADTIMSGVIHFIMGGSYFVAAVIFIASIFIPLAKLVVLVFLLSTVHFKLNWRPKDLTLLHGVTEAVGRWSMVDIYVVTILVGLVNLGAFALVEAGPAVGYFAAVVVLTMFAAESFDPRLIWDAIEGDDERR
jgi:paraquat-inducible protein A